MLHRAAEQPHSRIQSSSHSGPDSWPRPWARRFRGHASTLAARALVLTLVLASAAGAAHDWLSPNAVARTLVPDRSPPELPSPGNPPWQGLSWGGPSAGPPPAPSATDCRRAPVTFDVAERPPEPMPAQAPMDRMHRERIAESRTSDASSDRPASRIDDLAASTRSRSFAPLAMAPGVPNAMMQTPPAQTPQAPRPVHEAVTAGVIDDNADFGEYQSFVNRNGGLQRRELAIADRVRLDVRDATGRPVPDAAVAVYAAGNPLPLWARTDASGKAWLMPQAGMSHLGLYEVQISKGGLSTRVVWQRGQKDVLQARLKAGAAQRARLDLAFLIDATGSMADEIDKLKRTMKSVADQIATLPSKPDVCYGLVAYRDRGDAFFVRAADFTHDLAAFQLTLARLEAGGGGDYPEALNEALHTAVHRLSWRGEGTARLVLLVADAPPHLDYGRPTYDEDVRGALARGIKLFAIGASGLDRQGEFIFRQAAQFTGGRFVFLTYAQANRPDSGPGRETVHDVSNYSVETLDKLVVRLVREELSNWP